MQLCCDVQKKGTAESSMDLKLGSAELWIPSLDNTLIFAAPDMIIHYVETHQYRPPECYQQAAIRAANKLCWDAAAECERALNSAYQN